MADRRRRNVDWFVADESGRLYGDGLGGRIVAVLMDIRDELNLANRRLSVLECRNFLRIPHKLDRIGRNTERKKRKAVK